MKFKHTTFRATYVCGDGTKMETLIQAESRFNAYSKLCELFPVKAGYSKRFIHEQV